MRAQITLLTFQPLTKMISKPMREDADNKASFFSKIENRKLYNEGTTLSKIGGN